jgi:hypothetical protein
MLVWPYGCWFFVILYTGQSANQEWPRRPIWGAELTAEHRLPSVVSQSWCAVRATRIRPRPLPPSQFTWYRTLHADNNRQTSNNQSDNTQSAFIFGTITLRHEAGSREKIALNQLRVCLLCRCCSKSVPLSSWYSFTLIYSRVCFLSLWHCWCLLF